MVRIWLVLLVGSVLVGAAHGRLEQVSGAAMQGARLAVETVIGLLGLITFWLGIARIAERAGLVTLLARGLAPLVGPLFPSLPRDHPALGAILMNLSANMLGLGHAATPFGLKAMQELQRLNPRPQVATEAMCTFLALNTSSVTLIPATVIALRAAAGSRHPAEIVPSTLIATTCSTAVALLVDTLARRLARRR
jgi:spore maturation protein A